MPYSIYLIPLFPLLGSLFNGFFGKILGKRWVTVVAPLSIGLAFLQSLHLFLKMLKTPGHLLQEVLYTWIGSGHFQIPVILQVDRLSGLFLLVITGVGFLIHVYSVAYMHKEEGYYRYFSYLNLFIFFMLILVLAENLLVLFVGWEGVGLCSYLLIGYYFKKPTAGDAAKKAFIFNRIGDLGFITAALVIFIALGTWSLPEIAFRSGDFSHFGATLVVLLLFLAATGKSAQIPLYVWLPDAMEGPTPVSALIHAATMVTSGLYLMARMSHVFVLAPGAMMFIASVGAATALLAATIAITQTDIKRVLAYSTVSQLGYMFLAMGLGAFGAGVFHVVTHAFFKALLFLGAGSVIHALHHEQNMLKMGGLGRKLPWTYITMLIGTAAIAGIPPFAGFFSKDEILWHAWSQGGKLLWSIGLITSCLTSFYMFRLIFLTFHGSLRMEEHESSSIHESSWGMRLPLGILAVLSTLGGFLGIPPIFHAPHLLETYFEGMFASFPVVEHGTTQQELGLMAVAVAVAVISAVIAWWMYGKNLDRGAVIQGKIQKIYQGSLNKWYVDEVYHHVLVRPGRWISHQLLWKWIDVGVIDRTVISVGPLSHHIGNALKLVQNGKLQRYLLVFTLGVIGVLWYLVF